jgi:CheY-like chemotaxis protein
MAKILIVDDSTLSRSMAAKALKDLGHEVVEAADGSEGIQAFENQHFDCLVTDLLMPIVDGHELLTRVRAADERIPIIVLTADIQSSTREMCSQLAISAFLNKPVKAGALQAGVREALAGTQGRTSCTGASTCD